MKILPVAERTYCIDTGMTYIPFFMIDEQKIIMLDSGWADGEQTGIASLLEENNFNVAGIINTHAHIDHIGNNTFLKQKYNCPIAMPRYEAMLCHSPVEQKLYYYALSLDEIKATYQHMVFDADYLIEQDQTSFSFLGFNFGIVHTPGHSPDHICIITPDKTAYIGDVLISHAVMRGAKMPYAYILGEDLKSKAKLYNLNYNKYVIAHKGIYDNITELITENLNFYKFRAKHICALITGPMTFQEVTQAVIAGFRIPITGVNKYMLIERMLKSYLEYLLDMHWLVLSMDDGFLKYQQTIAAQTANGLLTR